MAFADIELQNGIPCSKTYQDPYFSDIGAIAEKQHIFIEGNALPARFKAHQQVDSPLLIGEIGFGLGINFLLTWRCWLENRSGEQVLDYIATEKHPVRLEQLTALHGEFPELTTLSNEFLEHYPILTPGFHRIVLNGIRLTLLLGDSLEMLNQVLISDNFKTHHNLVHYKVTCWYLDGFSPKKNQAQWSLDLLKTMQAMSDHQTTLTTYSVARQIKDLLDDTGFHYQKKTGIGRKRSFLFARYQLPPIAAQKKVTGFRNTPWHCQQTTEVSTCKTGDKIAIIGAGIAGCYMAHLLANRGFQVKLFDKQSSIASLASGNSQGLVHFKLSAFQSLRNEFLLAAFTYAIKWYQQLGLASVSYGVAELYDEQYFLNKIIPLFKNIEASYPELLQLLTPEQLNRQAGIALDAFACFWPSAFSFSPKEICQRLIQHPRIETILNREIQTVQRMADTWHVDEHICSKVILTTGGALAKIEFTKDLPLSHTKSATSEFEPIEQSKQLKIALCKDGYIIPCNDFCPTHVVGGESLQQQQNIATVQQAHLSLFCKRMKCSSETLRQSIRQCDKAQSFDYLPYVGAVPHLKNFIKQYKQVAKDKNIIIDKPGCYYPGIYVLGGLGAHGFLTVPLAGQVLLCHIMNELPPVSRDLLKALSPARFIMQKIIKNKY